MAHFLYDRSARFAMELVIRPLLGSLAASKMTDDRDAIHIVLIDPSSPRDEPTILVELTIGEIPEGMEYVAIARQKAFQAWREQRDTRETVRLYPHLLMDGDVLYAGGVYRHHMACGVSGLRSAWDEVIAAAAIEACRALCFETSEPVIADRVGPNFLPTTQLPLPSAAMA